VCRRQLSGCSAGRSAADVGEVALSAERHLRSGAESGRERDAVEIFAGVAVADRRSVEDDEQHDDDGDAGRQADDDADQLEPAINHVERDERHQGESDEQAEQKAEQVRVVVDHRQQPDQEQDEHVARQLEDLNVRSPNDVPVVNHFDEEAGQYTEL